VFPASLVHRFDRWQDIVNALTERMIERGTLSGTDLTHAPQQTIAAHPLERMSAEETD
jgi:hypothetical protein